MKNHPLPPLLLILIISVSLTTPSPALDRRRLIDRIIHAAAFHSFPSHHKTAVPYAISLPPSLSSASAHAIRFRAGRLRRQGVHFNNFHLPPGLIAQPHSKRLLIVLQNLANLSSSLYSLPGYHLISPILGLLIYDAGAMNSIELGVRITEEPIEVNFSGIDGGREIKGEFLCAVFGLNGRVELSRRGGVCAVWDQGHFGLVAEGGREEKGVGRWKVLTGVAVAGVVGVVFIGLVAVAVVKSKRKEWRMGEMERRAYEDEVLRMSMVGSLRAYTAAAVRTAPVLETEEGMVM